MDHDFDVIVLGSGLSGSTVGAAIAAAGGRVLLVEKGRHPRFALGESTLPQTSYWMWLIAQRYGLPELAHLASADGIRRHVGRSSGIKRSIGFAYHEPGMPLDVRGHTHQFLAPEVPFLSESHLWRADVDLYMVRSAQARGAVLREGATVTGVRLASDGVSVEIDGEAPVTGRYLVDATGFASIVARTQGLREEPTRLKTRSRAIFTHVEGVAPFDDLYDPSDLPGLKYRWHDGTLHHVFDGGWLWVIPFGNGRASSNPAASLGLCLDLGAFPPSGLEPEAEFWQIVRRFPTIARHLANVRATRPWTGVPRLQYSSTACLGERWFVTPQAYGSVDALYSRGMIMTFRTLYVFLGRLLAALRDDDFSRERFAALEPLQRTQLDDHDGMVSNAYEAMADFGTWDAWTKIWIASKLYGDLWLMRTCMRAMASHERDALEAVEREEAPFAARMRAVVDNATRVLDASRSGELHPREAARSMLASLRASDWLPHNVYRWGDPEARHGDFTPETTMPRVILWGKTAAPRWVRRGLFDFPVGPLLRMKLSEKLGRRAAA